MISPYTNIYSGPAISMASHKDEVREHFATVLLKRDLPYQSVVNTLIQRERITGKEFRSLPDIHTSKTLLVAPFLLRTPIASVTEQMALWNVPKEMAEDLITEAKNLRSREPFLSSYPP